MGKSAGNLSRIPQPSTGPAIRFLVESALRRVASDKSDRKPKTQNEWVEYLAAALVSESETSHHSVMADMVSSGLTREDIHLRYVPAAARHLGEKWVSDELSFVDVTVGSARMQRLFRSAPDGLRPAWADRVIPVGQSVLMIIPSFEDHSLGAFVAADQLRRHGLWVHMAIGLEIEEVAETIRSSHFSMLGISVATWNTVEKATELVDYIRVNVSGPVPPIVIGGRGVSDKAKVVRQTGADFAVETVREAVERCGLASVAGRLLSDVMG